jgi:chemotaxis-related protein WspD
MSRHEENHIKDCWNLVGIWSKKSEKCADLINYGHCRNCPTYSKTGRLLLDRPLSDDYRQELIDFFKKSPKKIDNKNQSAFVFRAGGEWLALPSSLIAEVVNFGPIHSIPHKNSRIFRGIVNIKGRLELCVSIGGLLRIGKRYKKIRGLPATERLIVVQKDDQSIVFPVTEVLGIFHYNFSQVKPLPATVAGSKAVYTKGILPVKGRDVGLLEDKILFRILTRNIS